MESCRRWPTAASGGERREAGVVGREGAWKPPLGRLGTIAAKNGDGCPIQCFLRPCAVASRRPTAQVGTQGANSRRWTSRSLPRPSYGAPWKMLPFCGGAQIWRQSGAKCVTRGTRSRRRPRPISRLRCPWRVLPRTQRPLGGKRPRALTSRPARSAPPIHGRCGSRRGAPIVVDGGLSLPRRRAQPSFRLAPSSLVEMPWRVHGRHGRTDGLRLRPGAATAEHIH